MHLFGRALCPSFGARVEGLRTGRRKAHNEEISMLVQRRDDVASSGEVALGMKKKEWLSEPFKIHPSTVWWQRLRETIQMSNLLIKEQKLCGMGHLFNIKMLPLGEILNGRSTYKQVIYGGLYFVLAKVMVGIPNLCPLGCPVISSGFWSSYTHP